MKKVKCHECGAELDTPFGDRVKLQGEGKVRMQCSSCKVMNEFSPSEFY